MSVTVSSATKMLSVFEMYVRQDNAETMEKYISVLNLGDLDKTYLDKLFVMWGATCQEYDSNKCARMLLSCFNDATQSYYTETIPYEVYMFTLRSLPDLVLSYFASVLDDTSPIFILEQLSSATSLEREDVLNGIHRCIGLFSSHKQFKMEDVNTLRQRAYENNHTEIADALGLLWSSLSPPAPRPLWIVVPPTLSTEETLINERAEPIVQKRSASANKTQRLTLDDAVDIALSGIDLNSPERRISKDILRSLFQTMTEEERYATLRPCYENASNLFLHDDAELQRILGPANPLAGADLTLDEDCSKYGGCRMLLCTCFEENPDVEDERVDDWFTGMCDACERTITKRWYAVRMPLDSGGWQGCFCSVSCMRLKSATLLNTIFIKNLESQLEDIGIYDRLD